MKRKSLLTKAQREREHQKYMQYAVGIFFIVLMVTSVGAFVFQMNPNSVAMGTVVEEFGYSFTPLNVEGGQLWKTGEDYFFLLPSQVLSFATDELATDALLQSQAVVVTFDEAMDDGQYVDLFLSELYDGFSQGVQFGSLTVNNSLELPQITCADATEQTAVLQILMTNATGLSQEGNCFTLSGFDSLELFYVTQYLKYRLKGYTLE